MRFREFFLLYLPFAQAQASWMKIRYVWPRFLNLWGDLELSEISTRTIDTWMLSRKMDVTAASVVRELNCLAGFFRQAVTWGYLDRSPCQGIRREYCHQSRFRVFTADESRQLIDFLSTFDSLPRWIVTVLHDTGMRPSEVRRLRWSDVNFRDQSFILRKTKTGRGRVVYWTPRVAAATAALTRSGAGPVSTWPRSKLDRVCSFLEDFTLYDLRKNFITQALRAGNDIQSVSDAVGCCPKTILKFYAAADDSRSRDLYNRAMSYCSGPVQMTLISKSD